MFSSAQPDLLPSMSQYTLLRGPPPRQQRRHRPALTVNRDPFPPRPAPPRPRLAHTTAASLFAFFFVVVGWVALEGCGGVGRFLLFFLFYSYRFPAPLNLEFRKLPIQELAGGGRLQLLARGHRRHSPDQGSDRGRGTPTFAAPGFSSLARARRRAARAKKNSRRFFFFSGVAVCLLIQYCGFTSRSWNGTTAQGRRGTRG